MNVDESLIDDGGMYLDTHVRPWQIRSESFVGLSTKSIVARLASPHVDCISDSSRDAFNVQAGR